MGLFTDIYNTVAKFFRSQDEQSADDPSKAIAQNRLKLVLMQDRTNLTPKVLEQMRGEMIELLSKYLEMDKDLLELNFEQDGNQVALMLSIPVIRAKDEEEIEAAMNKTDDVDEADESDDESAEEDYEEDESDTIDLNEEDNLEDIEVAEEEVKPKKRHSKKVSAPDELSGNDENNNEEMNSGENSEQTEQNTVCEQSEG